jgi:hypothetical protein
VTVDDRLAKVLGLSALADLVVGLVLLVVGLRGDHGAMSIAGFALVVAGAGVLTVVAILRSRPTRL